MYNLGGRFSRNIAVQGSFKHSSCMFLAFLTDFHENYVKIKRENPHECDVCGQTFDKSSKLKEHVFTHTGVKPYECHLCDGKLSFTM